MVAAARGTAEQPDQIESLAIDLLIRIHAVVRYHHQRSRFRFRTILNSRPYSADNAVEFFDDLQLRCSISGMMGDVIIVLQNEIEIMHLWILQGANKLLD